MACTRCPKKNVPFSEIGALLTKEHFFWDTLYVDSTVQGQGVSIKAIWEISTFYP